MKARRTEKKEAQNEPEDKRNLIILVIGAAILYWYWPTISGVGAMRPQPNQVQHIAPAPINQARQPSQPLYIAPAPQQQPVTIQQLQPAPIEPSLIREASPAQVIIMPTLPPQPTQATDTIIIDAMPTKDWTGEITAVDRSLALAVDLVETCARNKVKAALEMPPRIVDCRSTVSNLERAQAAVYELQELIRESRNP